MFLDSVIDTAWDTYKLWKTSKNLVHYDILHIQTVQHARAMSKSQAIPSFFLCLASTQKWKKTLYQENKYNSTEKPIQLLFRILKSFIIIILVFSLYCSKK